MIKKILSNELFRGSLILLITLGIYNFLNYLFHFSMARMLGPSDYGILAVLMSIVYIISVPSEAIQTIISKYTSKFVLKKEYGKIKCLIRKSLISGFKTSLMIFLLSIPLAFFVSSYLKINLWLIIITNSIIFFSILNPILLGVIQGRKRFTSLGNNMIIGAAIKLIFSICAVIIGFKVFGSIFGVLIGLAIAFLIAIYSNKEILDLEEEKEKFDGIYRQSTPYFVVTLVVMIMLSLDIILAKKFFSPELAGKYSVLSMLGKVIFFGTMAIGKVMFPLTSEKYYNKKDSSKLFYKSLLILLGICGFVVLIYSFFPELIVKILFGEQYLDIAKFLFYAGMTFTFLSFGNLILIYGLSIQRIRGYAFLFVAMIIEIILLFSFHGGISEYILALMVSNITIFLFSFWMIRK